MEAIIIFTVALLILIGLLGTILPALPGNILIFLAAALWMWWQGFENANLGVLLVLGILALLAQFLDYLAGAYGARKMGSSWWGVWGSVLGGFAGFVFLNIWGLITGVFLGAFLAEMLLARRDPESSWRAGWGSLLGFLCGSLMKFVLGVIMIALFLGEVLL